MSRPTAFAWHLQGPPGPPLDQALAFNEAVRAAVMRAGNGIGLARLPDALHGPHAAGAHTHAFWLAEDCDGDGRIDRALVHAPGGLMAEVIAALVLAGRVWLAAGADWTLVPAWLGQGNGGLWGPAQVWRTITPYVTPLWRSDRHGRPRPGFAPEDQLRREIARRGLPAPSRVCCPGTLAAPAAALRRPMAGRRAPGDAWVGAALVAFDRPVEGPLALGFGAHFGQGLFRPVRPNNSETLPNQPRPPAPG